MMVLDVPKYKKIEAITHTSPEYISFSQGTVKVAGTPMAIKEHIREKLKSEIVDHYQYVGGIAPLRAKIADNLSIKYGRNFSSEQIVISHGAIGGITAICLTLLNIGDEVILPEPAYPSYRNIIKFSKALPVYVPGYTREKSGWQFDIQRVIDSTTPKTKMIILSNPSNPCGCGLSQENLLVLKAFCEQRGIYLLFDEVYDNYIYEGTFNSGSPLVLDSEFVLRTGSFSKDYAMSGWRVGYILAPKKLVPNLVAIQDGTLCCPSVIGQYAALYALEHLELIQEQVKTVKENLDIVCGYLEPLVEKGIFSYIKPQGGIFLFIKTLHKDSEGLVMDILDKAKVALVPGMDFGYSDDTQSSLRLCFARNPKVVHEGMKRIINYFL